MATIWGLGGLTWKELAKNVWSEITEDDVFGRAAQLAYYFLLALFPLLLFLVSLLGYFAGENSELRADLFRYLSTVLPGEASDLVSSTMNGVIDSSGGGKLSLGILAALWAASNGMGAVSDSLNIAYDVEESRPWWKSRLIAIGLTIALALLIISALVLVLYGHSIAEAVAGSFGLGEVFELTWKIVQWPVVLAFVILGFGLIYYFAPNVKEAKWQWVTPGAVVGVVLWLLVSFAFRTYLSYFNTYSATYGSLGAVIILMLWFYLTGAAILIGGEINAEVEHAMAKAGAPDAKEKGEKSPGEKSSGVKDLKGGKRNATSGKSNVAASSGRADAKKIRPGNQPVKITQSSPARTANNAIAVASPAPKGRRGQGKMSLGKVAVVAGAWVLSKVWRGDSNRRPR